MLSLGPVFSNHIVAVRLLGNLASSNFSRGFASNSGQGFWRDRQRSMAASCGWGNGFASAPKAQQLGGAGMSHPAAGIRLCKSAGGGISDNSCRYAATSMQAFPLQSPERLTSCWHCWNLVAVACTSSHLSASQAMATLEH